MKTVYSESELVAALKTGSPLAFEFLYDTYSPALYGYLLQMGEDKLAAEKILIRTFIRMKSHFKELTNLNGRLFTIMVQLLHKEVPKAVSLYPPRNAAILPAV